MTTRKIKQNKLKMAIVQPNTQTYLQQSALMLQSCALTPTPAQLVHIKGPGSDEGLDALISGHAAQRHEKKRKIKVSRKIRESKVKGLLVAYEQYLSIEGVPQQEFVWRNIDKKDVLTPLEINAFLQMTIEYENCERSSVSNGIGYFISPLIQNSYNAGYNDFVLDTSNFKEKIDKLGWFIKGRRDKSINIKVVGDLGDDCFVEGKYVSGEIYGNVGISCGNDVKYSYFKIDGNVDEWCSHNAEYSSFIINGSTKDKCGHNAKTSSFIIKGEAIFNIHYFHLENSSYQLDGDLIGTDFGGGCTNCEFLTSNQRTLKKLLQSKLKEGTSNRIYFVRANGTKKLIWNN